MTSKTPAPPAPEETPSAPEEAPSAPSAPEPDHLSALDAEPEEIENPAITLKIDDRIKAFVDRGAILTIQKPRKWFAVALPAEKIREVTRDAKRYARETGRTFRVKNTGEEGKLVYRVTPQPEKREEKETG